MLELEDLDDSMDIATLDGFLTAIIIGERPILPSEWMPWIWDMDRGERSPTFKNQAHAERMFALIFRHQNDINTTLNKTPDGYEPLIMENPNSGDPIPVIDEWCAGFVKGMSLDEPGWASVPASLQTGIANIELYGTKSGWAKLEALNLPLAEHRRIASGLAETVRKLHAHFAAKRRASAAVALSPSGQRSEPLRNAEKAGRNEPCPCGSGKKYKKCCGSAKLH